MKNPYPNPLPAKLYVVTTERVRAGKPPIVIDNPQYLGDGINDKSYVHGKNPKFTYRIERCWPTPELAAEEVKKIGLGLIAHMQSQMSNLQRQVRKARHLADELASPGIEP